MTEAERLNSILVALGHASGFSVSNRGDLVQVQLPKALISDPIEMATVEFAARESCERLRETALSRAAKMRAQADTIEEAYEHKRTATSSPQTPAEYSKVVIDGHEFPGRTHAVAIPDHIHELGSCSVCDRQTPEEPARPSPAQTATDGLVERLAAIVQAHLLQSWLKDYLTDWDNSSPATKNTVRDAIRAILSELAKMPVELPTADEIRAAWIESPEDAPYKSRRGDGVLGLLRSRLAPILVAKDAEIERMRGELGETYEWFTKNVIPTHAFKGPKLTLLQRIENLLVEYQDNTKHCESAMANEASLRKRIAELEARPDAVEALRELRKSVNQAVYDCAVVGHTTDGVFTIRADHAIEAAVNAVDAELAKLEGKAGA